ncbi:hypothetical protein PV08_02678 [Exophiala spinifera]|uniref:Ribosomal RNA-processing protein 40 n=1 Tax=Exophiala spinifera TaxID=91928 RepID=A0A0D2BIG9_9EURO|nr:uncharacterized protein PV08_02678 [Exophiala spinifera]KIW18390.1 hypothetical protein PV08_02678 [Exophiala spinifera]
MATTQIVLPGDIIPATQLPTSQKRKIGRGLKQDAATHEYMATVGGLLEIDFRRKAAQVSTPSARYVPKPGDLVIAQVRGSSVDFFHVHINAHSPPAVLPQLAFEGATKKTRPNLKPNDLVYAKVVSAQKNMEVELSCVNPSTGKAEPDGLGPLTGGGMVFDVSPGLAERLIKKIAVVALDDLGARLPGGFEIAVGCNGKVWVECAEAGVRGTCAVGRCLREMDELELTEKDQRKLVNRIIADFERG